MIGSKPIVAKPCHLLPSLTIVPMNDEDHVGDRDDYSWFYQSLREHERIHVAHEPNDELPIHRLDSGNDLLPGIVSTSRI